MHWDWCKRKNQVVFWTTEDVEPGTELTICYDKRILFDPTEVRQREIERKFKFRCCCESCSLIKDARIANDAQRFDTALRLVQAMRAPTNQAHDSDDVDTESESLLLDPLDELER